MFAEQDRNSLGNVQIDLVEHCGASASGEYANTLDCPDIYSGWTEQDAIMGKGQEATKEAIDNCRNRCPFLWKEIHSDGGTNFINAHIFAYSVQTNLEFSRSRPYKKNDNCMVEQKNWTHVRKKVGYLRYDTLEEVDLLNDLYRNELRLYKNFFCPVIKLVAKNRFKGRIHRKYDKPKTPYQRLLLSPELSEKTKQELKEIYLSLNPALLKRAVDKKIDNLYQFYKQKKSKDNFQNVDIKKKISVSFSGVNQTPISVR